MDINEAKKIYNNIDLQYHMNNFNLRYACKIHNLSLKQYREICKQLNLPSTITKRLKVTADGRGYYYCPIDEE